MGEYIGKTMCGFINGNIYKINIDKNVYGYTISGIENISIESLNDACINYASEKSIRRNWNLYNEDLD